MSQVLIILGMHRSGTSLLARYLADSGVYMGFEMLPRHISNPAGHYEDMDFLSLHNTILDAHGLNHLVEGPVSWQIRSGWRTRAEELIRTRDVHPLWGWKDPRTCLFLDFWKPLIHDAICLVCFRHYEPVVQSMISRDLTFYREATNRMERLLRPAYTKARIAEISRTYLRVWMHYNREILRHLQTEDFRYVLIPFTEISRGNFSSLHRLRDHGITLNPSGHFRPQKSRSRSRPFRKVLFDPHQVAEADEIWQQFTKLLQSAPVH